MNASPLIRWTLALSLKWFSLATSVFSWESILGVQLWQILVQHHWEPEKGIWLLQGGKNHRISWARGDLQGSFKSSSWPCTEPQEFHLRLLPKYFFDSGSLGAVELVLYFLVIPNLEFIQQHWHNCRVDMLKMHCKEWAEDNKEERLS